MSNIKSVSIPYKKTQSEWNASKNVILTLIPLGILWFQ